MKIGPIEPKHTPASTGPAERRTTAAAGRGAPEPSAKVELSASSSLAGLSTEEASFDKAKVERISAAIREGRFQVDAGAIADKLIANAQELLGRARN
ncbi:MAG: flagellar biosynthesis anti-sigma factor FlgM [Rubrivivax sp.]|nr:flagellar biosynthesis anti-sigma factor FlgM [Rubrivivax sp.]